MLFCYPLVQIIISLLLYTIEAVVGFENTSYQVREDTGNIVICAVIIQPALDINPIEFLFEVEFAANSETAGMYNVLYTGP